MSPCVNPIHSAAVQDYVRRAHPEDVMARRAHRLVRRVFWAVGVNDIWCFDQHDKWRRFEVYFDVAMEPFSNRILYLYIWWTNRSTVYNTARYIDQIEVEGGCEYSTRALLKRVDGDLTISPTFSYAFANPERLWQREQRYRKCPNSAAASHGRRAGPCPSASVHGQQAQCQA